jgi:hypothetical protein
VSTRRLPRSERRSGRGGVGLGRNGGW